MSASDVRRSTDKVRRFRLLTPMMVAPAPIATASSSAPCTSTSASRPRPRGARQQPAQRRGRQRRHDEQCRVGANRSCLEQLILRHDEILPQNRHGHRRADGGQMLERAVEKRWLGQDRDRRRARRRVAGRDRRGVVLGTKDAPGRRPALALGDDRDAAGPRQRRPEKTWSRLARLGLPRQRRDRETRLARFDRPTRRRHDRPEQVGGRISWHRAPFQRQILPPLKSIPAGPGSAAHHRGQWHARRGASRLRPIWPPRR